MSKHLTNARYSTDAQYKKVWHEGTLSDWTFFSCSRHEKNTRRQAMTKVLDHISSLFHPPKMR